ncbi:bifunctional glutamate N-acetyltransferase/amino-acid acetyltransferase ArgJ [Ruficoccus amylovorans]|uniref:Arginine biosynthesis bifunctional protein ArgJ n=1 Tax=Ruficoccus amylovorans TaxID=1804625 RepID=A0A842HJZ1_9BACT|nr:bifunctional glutamate N-acetyltransferase/amino-acid acetyltransferase ArgJ [Ruficoccus amylovorans]MBC2596440.1 bifunctional glutamate N-acetyltransferase/amino-acid acetyltransferase ArgJ [Ruficoccus amylovorans]
MSTHVTLTDDSPGLGDVPGFQLAGVHCDVRGTGNKRLDLALIFSEQPAVAAGVFTTNDVKAAPVRHCQAILAGRDDFRAIVANSGNANACTGAQGMADCEEMAAEAARGLGISADQVFVCSTGRIGRSLPMDKIRSGIAEAAAGLSSDSGHSLNAAWAILTSDTKPKTVTAKFEVGGQTVTVSGMAKGAGMIEPNMATMLAFVGTDAEISRAGLQAALAAAVRSSFNSITVDGDMSTNDTVLVLANGQSGVSVEDTGSEAGEAFREALGQVCRKLAEKIVGDGERITKVVMVNVSGAPDNTAAEKVARAVGNSLLVKTSWFGNDPNWGRLLDAAGYARVGLVEERLDMHYDDIPVILAGTPQHDNLPQWKQAVSKKHFSISINLNIGQGAYSLLSTDLSEGYVDFNKSE